MNETTVRKQPRKIFSGSTLKLVAIITMLIDHATAGIYLYELYAGHLPHGLSAEQSVALYEFLRDVGRTAFPIFCFLLVEGFLHTHDVKKYIVRANGELTMFMGFSVKQLRESADLKRTDKVMKAPKGW